MSEHLQSTCSELLHVLRSVVRNWLFRKLLARCRPTRRWREALAVLEDAVEKALELDTICCNTAISVPRTLQKHFVEAIATRLEAIASRLEAIASRLEAIGDSG